MAENKWDNPEELYSLLDAARAFLDFFDGVQAGANPISLSDTVLSKIDLVGRYRSRFQATKRRASLAFELMDELEKIVGVDGEGRLLDKEKLFESLYGKNSKGQKIEVPTGDFWFERQGIFLGAYLPSEFFGEEKDGRRISGDADMRYIPIGENGLANFKRWLSEKKTTKDLNYPPMSGLTFRIGHDAFPEGSRITLQSAVQHETKHLIDGLMTLSNDGDSFFFIELSAGLHQPYDYREVKRHCKRDRNREFNYRSSLRGKSNKKRLSEIIQQREECIDEFRRLGLHAMNDLIGEEFLDSRLMSYAVRLAPQDELLDVVKSVSSLTGVESSRVSKREYGQLK